MSIPALPWPENAPVLPISRVRASLDALASLAMRHPEHLQLVPGLAMSEEDSAADVPPALAQITDELGAVLLHGEPVLTLLTEERVETGPYTMLGASTGYYPLREVEDRAVVLALDEDGTAGAVYGIGEDLALRLAATDLPTWLERLVAALRGVLEAADGAASEGEDAQIEQVLQRALWDSVLGREDDKENAAVGAGPAQDAEAEGAPAVEGPQVPWQEPSAVTAGGAALPEATVLVADLREAPVGAVLDAVDALEGEELLEHQLTFCDGGRLVCLQPR